MSAASPTPETLNPPMNGHDSSSPTPETLNPPMSGHDSSSATPETLNPPMNGHDSSSSPTHQNPPPEQPTEKRKREDEQPDPSQDPDPSQLPPLWKTSLCSYYRRTNGSCSHGEKCRYAHGEAELRQRPDNTWDPTSERVKKTARKDDENVDGEGAGGDEAKVNADVMMTEAIAVADGEDGSIGEETWLSKCLRNLPMKWSSDNLRCFLKDQGLSFKSAKKKKGMIVGFVNFENSEQAKKAIKDLEGKAVGKKILTVADVIPRSFEKKNTVALPNSQNIEQSDKPEGASDSSNMPESSNNGEGDGQKLDDLTPGGSVSKGKSVRDVVTPLAHLSYPDQLEHKKHSLKQMLKKLTKNARKACPDGVTLPEWVLQAKDRGGLPCNFEGIIESPLVNGYRNKCEFSVGYSVQGKPTVGFSLGNFREGVTAIAEPTDCPNISKVACRCAAIFQEFLQNSSLPIWNRLNSAGFWRQLTVREGRMPRKTADVEDSISEVMLMVQVCTTGFDEELVKSEFKRMAQAFAEGATTDSIPMPLSALVVQDHKGISNAAPADAPLHSLPIPREEGEGRLEEINDGGEVRIRDHISNLQFCISPTAFFQVNTLAAEKLYALAGDWAGLGPDTLLFDVCCGTGTIGLTLAHRVGMVVGIEMNASAVSDAHRNADINGIKNCRFVCGKAEDVMGSLLKEYLSTSPKEEEIPNSSDKNDEELKTSEEKVDCKDSAVEPENCSALEPETGENVSGGPKVDGLLPKDGALKDKPTSVQHFKNVVAIVDPPRVGLHPTVTKVLRTHTRLKRLVYISCNPESLVANAIELCTPSVDKTEKGSNKDNRGWRNMSSAGLARHRVKSMPYSEPFKPVKAMAVDLFPHTPHCELVMLLER